MLINEFPGLDLETLSEVYKTGKPWKDPEHLESVIEADGICNENGRAKVECLFLRKDGTYQWISNHLTVMAIKDLIILSENFQASILKRFLSPQELRY